MDTKTLKRYAHDLCGNTANIEEAGLERGKTGAAIFLFHCYRLTKDSLYEETAESLIESVYSRIDTGCTMSYRSGLPGIGVGMEYLIRHRFVEGDSDEILEETDKLIADSVRSGHLGTPDTADGLCGPGYYFYFRLTGKNENGNNTQALRNKESLITLVDLIGDTFPRLSCFEIYDLYFLLKKIHALQLIPFKTEKLLEACRISSPEAPPVLKGYENLPIPILELLKGIPAHRK